MKPLVVFYTVIFSATGGGQHAMTLLAEQLVLRDYRLAILTRPPLRRDHRYVRRLAAAGVPVRCLSHLDKLWAIKAAAFLIAVPLSLAYSVLRHRSLRASPLRTSWIAARSIVMTRVAALEKRRIRREFDRWLNLAGRQGRKLVLHIWGPATLTPQLLDWAEVNSVPAIYHEMGEADETYIDTWRLRPTVEAIGKARWLICCSRTVAECVQRNYGYAGPMSTIPFMIKDPAEHCGLSRVSNGRVMFGAIGRLVAHKRHSDLLYAIKALVDRGRDVGLVIAGTGPLRDSLEDLSNRLCIGDRVVFTGEFEDLDQVMAQFDVFVLTSTSESQCMPITESMAYGKPVVASRFGGIPDFVEQGVTGFLVPVGNHDELIESLDRLIESPELRARMGELGRGRYLENYTQERVVEAVERVYESL
jgi:glycosyltransferase involved in cell wall biosynthesis